MLENSLAHTVFVPFSSGTQSNKSKEQMLGFGSLINYAVWTRALPHTSCQLHKKMKKTSGECERGRVLRMRRRGTIGLLGKIDEKEEL